MLEEALSHTAQYADTQLEQKLSDKLNFQYPYAYLEGLTVKTTVSGAEKGSLRGRGRAGSRINRNCKRAIHFPLVSGEEAVQGTQYGTAVHKVMELLSFDASYQNVPSDKVVYGENMGRDADMGFRRQSTEKGTCLCKYCPYCVILPIPIWQRE